MVVGFSLVQTAVCFRFNDHEMVGPEPVPSIEGASKAPGGSWREQREGNDFVDGLRALCHDDLV